MTHSKIELGRIRNVSLLLATMFGLGVGLGACDGASDQSAASTTGDALVADLVACDLLDGTVDKTAEIRACTPAEERHKTTICHIPPGNPANAHTLCVGNAAVPAHLQNHGDYLGPCKVEQPCPPPPPATGTGGAGTGGSSGDSHPGTGGAAGAPVGGSSGTYLIG
ncbi:MAG TPA: hypothetical protein VLT58_00645 [Polyangia bacterium]|nr:hypothetical protein [Polyangia bacterium]